MSEDLRNVLPAILIVLALVVIAALTKGCGGGEIDWSRHDCDNAYGRGWSLKKENVDRPCPPLDSTRTPQPSPSPSPTPAVTQYGSGLCKVDSYWQLDEDGTDLWIRSRVVCEGDK